MGLRNMGWESVDLREWGLKECRLKETFLLNFKLIADILAACNLRQTIVVCFNYVSMAPG